ncbi:hypothetical protein [Neisseria bergeri]|uniref:hypothetical protein n=1 Tax=Neisseria bergeri TaxID=1906581 RepID=UPI0027DFD19B|nr:hypothetical protein [Neisseria bergeri]
MNKKINKRVPVGLSEEEYRVFSELIEQIEQTMAKIVSEFVSKVIPVMKQMTANKKELKVLEGSDGGVVK